MLVIHNSGCVVLKRCCLMVIQLSSGLVDGRNAGMLCIFLCQWS